MNALPNRYWIKHSKGGWYSVSRDQKMLYETGKLQEPPCKYPNGRKP